MTAGAAVTEVDHLVVAAATLASGIDYVEGKLGVRVPVGGKHPVMSTHNAVMRLGSSVYLEVIAADPEAAPPPRPRWFALDHPEVVRRLADDGPFLITWVARTPSLANVARASLLPLGDVAAMSRGTLSWQAAIRADGALLRGGLFPGLVIEWPPGPHPMERMTEFGMTLQQLTLRPASPALLRDELASIGLADTVAIEATKRGAAPLEATIRRADGSLVRLQGGGTPLPRDAVCG